MRRRSARQSANRRWSAFRAYFVTGALTLAILIPPGLALAADPPNPHTASSAETAACSSCHVPHHAEGPSLTHYQTPQELCFSCHAAGSATDVQGEITAPGVKSSHPATSTTQAGVQCSDCHTPHQGPAENNPSSIRVSNEATSGVDVCGACHSDVVAVISEGHAGIVAPDSPARISCLGCHEPHASTNEGLIRSKIPVGATSYDVASQADLCEACHADAAAGIISGLTKHVTVSVDTPVALAGEGGSACGKCHDPHAGTVGASGDGLCLDCHAAAGLTYPERYSFRGQAVYGESSHAGLTSTNAFRTLGYDSAGFGVWERAGTAPTPSLPGSAVTSDEASKVVLIDGTLLETEIQTVPGEHDYQLYRFRVDVPAGNLRTMRVQWAGLAANGVVLSVWNPGLGSWGFLRGYSESDGPFAEVSIRNPQSVLLSQDVWVLVEAAYSSDSVSAPTLATDYIGLSLGYVGSESRGSCTVCHSMHGGSVEGTITSGQVVASEGRLCTGDGGTGCHGVDAAGTGDTTDIASKLAGNDPRMSHDLMPEAQAATGAKIACSSCHNPHADNATSSYADPDDISVSATMGLDAAVDEDGNAYVLIGAQHDGIAPVISGVERDSVGDRALVPLLTWTTDEKATSWVEWGTTDSYGSSAGSDALVTSHSESMAGLVAGQTYHYRIKSVDALGNVRFTDDDVYAPVSPAPGASQEGISPALFGVAEDLMVPTSSLEITAEAPALTTPGDAVWLTTHEPVECYTPGLYSVDTNRIVLSIQNDDGTRAYLSATEGWESASSAESRPTPSAPGSASAVDAATLLQARDVDTAWWQTSLAKQDGEFNWQVVRFDLSNVALGEVRKISFAWMGHGEPTPGYPTSVQVWDAIAHAWTLVKSGPMATDTGVSRTVSASDTTTMCLSCHDGLPPEGVVFPVGVTTIKPSWTSRLGDRHGAGAGTGFGITGLKPPYARSTGALACTVCHDSHGSDSLYHISAKVNGQAVPPIKDGSYTALCSACHAGNVRYMHEDCATACHLGGPDRHGDITSLLPDESSDCSRCHGHAASWTHELNRQTSCDDYTGACHAMDNVDYPRTF